MLTHFWTKKNILPVAMISIYTALSGSSSLCHIEWKRLSACTRTLQISTSSCFYEDQKHFNEWHFSNIFRWVCTPVDYGLCTLTREMLNGIHEIYCWRFIQKVWSHFNFVYNDTSLTNTLHEDLQHFYVHLQCTSMQGEKCFKEKL